MKLTTIYINLFKQETQALGKVKNWTPEEIVRRTHNEAMRYAFFLVVLAVLVTGSQIYKAFA